MAAEVASNQQQNAVSEDNAAANAAADKKPDDTKVADGGAGGDAAAANNAVADGQTPAAGATAAGDGDANVDGKNAGENHEGANNTAAPAKPDPPVKYCVHKTNFEKDVIYLYQFSRTPLLPSLSPYCLKVETWLRLAGLKYEVSLRMHKSGAFPAKICLAVIRAISRPFGRSRLVGRHF